MIHRHNYMKMNLIKYFNDAVGEVRVEKLAIYNQKIIDLFYLHKFHFIRPTPDGNA